MAASLEPFPLLRQAGNSAAPAVSGPSFRPPAVGVPSRPSFRPGKLGPRASWPLSGRRPHPRPQPLQPTRPWLVRSWDRGSEPSRVSGCGTEGRFGGNFFKGGLVVGKGLGAEGGGWGWALNAGHVLV